MSLAIVIPYYNIHFFDKTLFSLSCQTDKRFKVYIGNNNSPNDPMELIDIIKTDWILLIRFLEMNEILAY